MPKNYLIFGGTFDPPTLAHEQLVRFLQDKFRYDEVDIIPTKDPVPLAAKNPKASAEQRIEMLRLAFAKDPSIHINRMEVDRGGYSYTIDTLKALRTTLSEEDSLTLLIGADNYLVLHQWKDFQEIFTLCSVIVMTRPSIEVDSTKNLELSKALDKAGIKPIKEAELLARKTGGLYFINAGEYDVSSTKVREFIAEGRIDDAAPLLNPRVLDYLKKL